MVNPLKLDDIMFVNYLSEAGIPSPYPDHFHQGLINYLNFSDLTLKYSYQLQLFKFFHRFKLFEEFIPLSLFT